MTLDELRDWHANRAGWNEELFGDEEDDRFLWVRRDSKGNVYPNAHHPFPYTLDAADESFPPNWIWQRYAVPNDGMRWVATKNTVSSYRYVADTGDKIRDLYELSKMAWEQEAAR